MSYRTVMAADLKGYESAPQNAQGLLQRNLAGCLRDAAGRAGLDPERWGEAGRGDGMLMVLPPDVAVEGLAGRFVRELNAELRARNRLVSAAARVRMLLAIHHGPVAEAAIGYTGTAPVVVKRLCEADSLRDALDAAGADLGVIVSAFVYRSSVEAGMTSLDPADLRHVRLPGLGDDGDGWIWFPGGPDPHTVDFPDGLADGPAPEPEPQAPPGGPSRPDSPFQDYSRGNTYIGRDQNNYYGGRP
ncbi:hypothetical protein [Actinomadura decatromicini]|uniref:Guanylate cyclase domain-containing protein n=1 Tax=Actinomadura decatromicini TaxID=2604572 RepID=A0A5D3FWL9_9ACTN|nr:hypothetical protein [Actinomadura decatromicini]TYK52524.1 hypothetical protein FXF68_01755 [Actinomadura decatromicini]